MRGFSRLIEAFQTGDPAAMPVLIFAVAGTAAILAVVAVIRRRRYGK